MSLDAVLQEINEFLGCPTPDAWIQEALNNQETLLIDHANCEKKAARATSHTGQCGCQRSSCRLKPSGTSVRKRASTRVSKAFCQCCCSAF